MRILVVSFRFAPFASMGAARIGAFCAEWKAAGHEVRVITAAKQGLPETLENPLLPEEVFAVDWPAPMGVEAARSMSRAGWKRGLVRLYASCFLWPDTKSAWIPRAIEAAKVMEADVVFASGHPISSLVAGSKIAQRLGVPWVAELRDPWVGNAYGLQPFGWRSRLDLAWQRRLKPDAWVVATPGMADLLEPQLGVRPEVILSGYDARRAHSEVSSPTLDIVHTGELYDGLRDPTVFLDGLTGLTPEERSRVRVRFFGRDSGPLLPLVQARGLEATVEFGGQIDHAESLRLQSEADVLLLLTPNRSSESYVLPGKLFEYLGARRPIWVSGHPEGGAAKFVAERGLGDHLADAKAATKALREALTHKPGWVPRPAGALDEAFSRQHQALKLLDVLQRVTR